MRIAVTGRTGQVATALLALAGTEPELDIVALGRPELDLADRSSVIATLTGARPDAIVNAAAYTAVDRAETEPVEALAVNAMGAAAAAEAARQLAIPIVQISTDYVFDGSKDGAYVEDDPVCPIGAYGWSKLAGEVAVASITADHAILRTSWVYAATGRNFVNTMLGLAQTHRELPVVSDQFGCPTYAPDIARAVIAVCRNLVGRPGDRALRGVFHMAGAGETHRAGFAEAILAESALRGGPGAIVRHIASSDYPTAARRPANSRLCCARLEAIHGVRLPHWRDALARCLGALPAEPTSS